MVTIKTITLTDQQDNWGAAQFNAGHYTNDGEHIRNLIQREQADRYVDFLTSAFGELANSPKTAPACDHTRPGCRCWGVERHVIYLRVTACGIAVVRVLYDRMDATQHL